METVMRWSKHRLGFHTNIKKMYNTIQWRQKDWYLRRFIWQKNLDKRKILEKKIIHGVKSTDNQAERGLRETAKLAAKEYPHINQIIQNNMYVYD